MGERIVLYQMPCIVKTHDESMTRTEKEPYGYLKKKRKVNKKLIRAAQQEVTLMF